MKEWIYFTACSLLFYTIWYFSLGWFPIDETHKHGSLHFLTQRTYIQDLPREFISKSESPEEGPTREIWFLRLLLGVLLSSVAAFVVLRCPLTSENRTIFLLVVALVTPFIVVWLTYLELPLRFIPFFWGMMIGVCTVAILAARNHPWGLNPQQILQNMLGENYRLVLLSSLLGLIPCVAGIMAAVGWTEPIDWFGWCICIMLSSAIFTIVGLALARII